MQVQLAWSKHVVLPALQTADCSSQCRLEYLLPPISKPKQGVFHHELPRSSGF